MLGSCRAFIGPCWADVGPRLGHILSNLGRLEAVRAIFGILFFALKIVQFLARRSWAWKGLCWAHVGLMSGLYWARWAILGLSRGPTIGCGRMCSWEENARWVSLSPGYHWLGLAWTEAVSIKFRVSLQSSTWVGHWGWKFKPFFQGTLELELYRRFFCVNPWLGRFLVLYHLELYRSSMPCGCYPLWTL